MFFVDFFSHQTNLKRKNIVCVWRGERSNYSCMDTQIWQNSIIGSFLKHTLFGSQFAHMWEIDSPTESSPASACQNPPSSFFKSRLSKCLLLCLAYYHYPSQKKYCLHSIVFVSFFEASFTYSVAV
jgi:hypothetical protein